MRVYLGGAIRRTKTNEIDLDDIKWRENMTFRLKEESGIMVADPVKINKSFVDDVLKTDNFSWDSKVLDRINANDCLAMDQCEIGQFNLNAFSEGYPCIGSIMEIGYLTAQGKPVIIMTMNQRLIKNPMLSRCRFVENFREMLELTQHIATNIGYVWNENSK